MNYPGPERRRHHVYVTRNTEYHVRDGVCVAVRDRGTQCFRDAHIALRLKLEGGIKFLSNGAVLPHDRAPEIGDSLYFVQPGIVERDFEEDQRQIITSRIEQVARPPRAVVATYPMN